ncbi:GNAT family N-acetyltransferase [Micromonospora sp. NPDC004540]|uniref:GNAT family N-acetyltransferase n=1 Tax=Micromonospora sp. NPDC004540 TaxID=3154457 RepID=UPI0033B29A66
MPELIVRDMTRNEFEEWRDRTIRSFADEQVAAGNWPTDEALALATKANDVLLPDGFATAGMLFLKAVLPDGTYVGVLWLGLTHPRGAPDCAFIYDIEIDETYRGVGYGRALLAAAEDAVRSRGVGRLELNVFRDNARAIRLYETSGYHVVTQQMRKSLNYQESDRLPPPVH